jgi:hypothetical protein
MEFYLHSLIHPHVGVFDHMETFLSAVTYKFGMKQFFVFRCQLRVHCGLADQVNIFTNRRGARGGAFG